MKPQFLALPSLILAVLIAIGPLGCAGPETSAFRLIGTTATTVDGFRKGWNQYVHDGHAKTNQVIAVADAYEKYQKAMALAQSAVSSYKTNADKSLLNQATDAVSAASGDFTALVQAFQRKPMP